MQVQVVVWGLMSVFCRNVVISCGHTYVRHIGQICFEGVI